MILYDIVRSILFVLCRMIFRIKIHSEDERVNTGEPLIVCSNHRTGFDPVMIAITFKGRIRFMAKKELFKNRFIGAFNRGLGAFPVDRSGNSLSAIKNSLKILRGNHTLGIFPEGTRMEKYDESAVKGGIGMLAVKSKATIMPVYVESKFRPFSRVDIYYGKKFDFRDLNPKELESSDYVEISKSIMRKIYSLKDGETS
ncbi:1-acyl-sn-glycerol-3-phosphate acyltransferase [Dethiosulfatibacter aminovorans DSM 17477]|uniref:1-acyl-sn-glycerol-3-phosphate acyltransferase n=1 Tax=Dethiosulfatibacter aminovorans DSM 17477 TaxID=1121476 RepID=A0A1M6DB47_9FIRM|nr:lysophospholipid acyltransferase family protein [Dethiosulfatibacter aminovorans]SHI70457.1 1-acyl-sn-glycerol-3-phosphate acyltransferase [Dethiosulfatibacter aminovorans DSM 17477]